jgi:ABC-2 type transport system ATP-binding protein
VTAAVEVDPAALDRPPSSGCAVETFGLAKSFRGRPAVAGIDMQVPLGSVYGFLGPNGSGKTTTLRMLVGLIRPSAGTINLLGEPMPAGATRVLPHVGSLIEGPAFHPYLSGAANLARLDAADRHSDPRTASARIDKALERVGLTAAAGKRYRAFSLGMKQRLAIAGALLQPRQLVVLDEPTNGLDPQGTREVRHLVASLASDGTTVLVSSHLLSEIEQTCTHVGVMREGYLVAQGTVADLRNTRADRIRVDTDRPSDAASVLNRLGLTEVTTQSSAVIAVLGSVDLGTIVPALVAAHVPVLGFAVERPSLEDLFVSLTGEGFDVSG